MAFREVNDAVKAARRVEEARDKNRQAIKAAEAMALEAREEARLASQKVAAYYEARDKQTKQNKRNNAITTALITLMLIIGIGYAAFKYASGAFRWTENGTFEDALIPSRAMAYRAFHYTGSKLADLGRVAGEVAGTCRNAWADWRDPLVEVGEDVPFLRGA